MDANKVLAIISRAGSVILTTVLSFVVLPPSMDGDSNSVINWKNIFTFFAGIISIFLYEKMKGKSRKGAAPFILVGLLVVCAGAYQVIYNSYSIKCYDKLPIIVTTKEVRPEMKDRLAFWKSHSQDPIRSLLESNGCSSVKVWTLAAIALPYYSLLVLYFAIIVIVVLLIVLTSDLVIKPSPKP